MGGEKIQFKGTENYRYLLLYYKVHVLVYEIYEEYWNFGQIVPCFLFSQNCL